MRQRVSSCLEKPTHPEGERYVAERLGRAVLTGGCGGQGSDAVDGLVEIDNETAVKSPSK